MTYVNLADMGEKFAEYSKLRLDNSLDEKEIPRIDQIWSPVIQNPKYQYLSKFLRAVLSFIHSTTAAEGSIQDFRKIVGSYSHRTSDKTCTARMSVLSATRSAGSDCCYDYNQNIESHRINWRSSSKASEENNEEENEDFVDSE